MKTLMVKSDTLEQDYQAACMINAEMVKGDSKKIVWYSSLAKTLAKIDEHDSSLKANEVAMERLKESYCILLKDHSNLSRRVVELSVKLEEHLAPPKEEPKKKKGKS